MRFNSDVPLARRSDTSSAEVVAGFPGVREVVAALFFSCASAQCFRSWLQHWRIEKSEFRNSWSKFVCVSMSRHSVFYSVVREGQKWINKCEANAYGVRVPGHNDRACMVAIYGNPDLPFAYSFFAERIWPSTGLCCQCGNQQDALLVNLPGFASANTNVSTLRRG